MLVGFDPKSNRQKPEALTEKREGIMAHPNDFGLTDPKLVGATEYAAIYETLVDALDGCEDDVADRPRDFALAILDEFISHAQAIKTAILAGGAQGRRGSTG